MTKGVDTGDYITLQGQGTPIWKQPPVWQQPPGGGLHAPHVIGPHVGGLGVSLPNPVLMEQQLQEARRDLDQLKQRDALVTSLVSELQAMVSGLQEDVRSVMRGIEQKSHEVEQLEGLCKAQQAVIEEGGLIQQEQRALEKLEEKVVEHEAKRDELVDEVKRLRAAVAKERAALAEMERRKAMWGPPKDPTWDHENL